MVVMKPWRLLLSVYLGFLFSCLLLFLFSASGLRSYRALAAYRDILQRNITELELLQRSLAGEQEALRTDPGRIALQARELGWFEPGQRVVRLDSRTVVRDPHPAGSLVRPARAEPHNATLLRILCLALPFGFYLALRFLGRRWQHAGRRFR